ncbi:hypothetical protein BK133_30550 [Paenibacillus sp. FSL H8-0548]|uniref:sensor histidine kinase n=1 Tax=Paenibacillus sp. FSL H8-0548 TaxID=1920422 RepID=UPI00096F9C79|nr:histidine kinase [Paenibacillus sp. FSL H8-0548]OMF18508.1 hypothetical protein BK133_30550 [Paenibacillus sp. FSL H8-0548]
MPLAGKSFFNSIRFKLIFGLIVVMLPVLSLLIYNNLYSIQVVRNQVAQSNSNLLDLYMGLIDKELTNIDTYLFQFATKETRLNYLERPAEEDLDRYSLSKYQLFRELYDNSNPYYSLDFFFVYSIVNEDLLLAPKSLATETANTMLIKNSLNGIFQDQNKMLSYPYEWWSSLNINESAYLIHIIKTGNVYIGALVNYKQIMEPLDKLDLGTTGKSLLVGANNEPLQDAAFFEANQIKLNYEQKVYHLTGKDEKYLVIGEKSDKGDFSLLAVLPDRSILEKLPYAQRVIVGIVSGAVLILMAALFLLRKIILLPINRIMVAMRKIKGGHLEARIKDVPTSYEFQLMNESFNSMVSEIQKLKIDIYEEQLFNQKAELKHLQLQINPHFYLNSLNTFYYLADDKNYVVMKELSLSLIEYFRFMFRSHSDFVALREEIKHARNYLRIQEFRFPGGLTYDFSVDDSLMDCSVPPLIVQTFVENAIKHAVTLDELVQIHITINSDESSPDH